jgi:hypothetical protein
VPPNIDFHLIFDDRNLYFRSPTAGSVVLAWYTHYSTGTIVPVLHPHPLTKPLCLKVLQLVWAIIGSPSNTTYSDKVCKHKAAWSFDRSLSYQTTRLTLPPNLLVLWMEPKYLHHITAICGRRHVCFLNQGYQIDLSIKRWNATAITHKLSNNGAIALTLR